jgi:D-alanyl-D-alanine carboxypeptidase
MTWTRLTRRAFAVSLGIVLTAGLPASAGTGTLDDILAGQFARSPYVPGIAASVDAPGLRWGGSVGKSDVADGVPLRRDDTFRVASITKTFTAAAVLTLVDQRRVALDAPISRYLPGVYLRLLQAGGYRPDVITVRQLLSHTSGLYDYATDAGFFDRALADLRHRWTPIEQVGWAMTHGHPYGQPGEKFHYSDTGYVMLARIVESVTGLAQAPAYRTLLRYDCLGLTSTWFETLEPAPRTAGPRAHQYLVDPASGLNVDTYPADPSFDLFGGGGLVSSLADLNRFYRALLQGRVISGAALQTMLTLVDTDHTAGMGIFTKVVDGVTCWWHNGVWGSATVYCPDRGLAVSVTVNAFVMDHSSPGALTDATELATTALRLLDPS